MPLKNRKPSAAPHTAAAAFLSSIDADWARLVAQVGPCMHESKPAREPYEALTRAVAYQQLHVKAGDAILARLLALYPTSPFPSSRQLLDTEAAEREKQRPRARGKE